MSGLDQHLRDYPFVLTLSVQWGEMDALQHVNNTVYYRYFESCRIAYFAALTQNETLPTGAVGPILAESSCRFRVPLTYPDTVRVGARTSGCYEYGFVHEYAIVSEKAGVLAATGTSRIVMYDYATKQKAPLSPAMIARIESFEGKVLPRLSKA